MVSTIPEGDTKHHDILMIYKISNPKAYLHPANIFCCTWIFLLLLYNLRLSYLLIDDNEAVYFAFSLIIIPFLIVSLPFIGISAFNSINKIHQKGAVFVLNEELISKKLRNYFCIWGIGSIIEIIYSKGIPLLWLATTIDKTYFDFGIPSMHGFMNSFIFAASLISSFMYYVTRRRKYLFIPIFAICWGVLVISRHLIITNSVQLFSLSMLVGNKGVITKRNVLFFFFLLLIVYLFGVIGDIRGVEGLIRAVGQPTDSFPSWLPSGFLWVYIYLVTPVNNLINTMLYSAPITSYTFSTFSSLFPSVIRNILYDVSQLTQGLLVSDNLNMSTAFVAPYNDMGNLGIILWSVAMGIVSNVIWISKKSPHNLLVYAIIAQCLFMSLFVNHMLLLPVLFQLLWLKLIINKATFTTINRPRIKGLT